MTRVRSLFVSDAHMGSAFCRSTELLEFLTEYDFEYLYLVGDFIDGWKFQNNFYWPDGCNDVFHFVLQAAKEKKVFYAIGNHDEFLRHISPVIMGRITVQETFRHSTIDGRLMWIRHGDFLDKAVRNMAWLAHWGDWALGISLWLNRLQRKFEKRIGFKYFSLSNLLKRNVEAAIAYVNNFEELILKETRGKNYDGVICGHIHKPAASSETGYYNCGDWVEHGTAIVEHLDGRLELVKKHLVALDIISEYDWPG